jgi:enoyl-CoA hydratase/carnithine racemase
MQTDPTSTAPALAALRLLQVSIDGPVVHLRLHRPEKRNAINDSLIAELHTAFVNLPPDAGAVVLSGAGAHFCAGLDLSE